MKYLDGFLIELVTENFLCKLSQWNDALSENIPKVSQQAREYVPRGVAIPPQREKNHSQSLPMPLSLSKVYSLLSIGWMKVSSVTGRAITAEKQARIKWKQTWRIAFASSVFSPSTSIRLRTAATLLASLNSKSPAWSFFTSAAFVVAWNESWLVVIRVTGSIVQPVRC